MATTNKYDNPLFMPTVINNTSSLITRNDRWQRLNDTGHIFRNLSVIVGMLFLSACANKINQLPEESDIEVPAQWQATEIEQEKPSQPDIQASKPAEPVQENWLSSFDDAELNQYVSMALQNNPDLLQSAAQLRNAIEQVSITGSNLWPAIQANVNGRENEQFFSDPNGGVTTTTTRTISKTLDVSWEIDVWRKLSQRKKAAALNAKAQAELFKAAELSLVANVSRAWFNLVTNKLQLDLAQRRLESFKSTAQLIDENYQRGLRSALDVYLSRTDVQRQISALADSRFSYVQSLRTFKTLLGEYPSADMEFKATLPGLSSEVSAGLPAELMTRRPDLRASLLQYQAQIATARAAQRDLYPSLNFTGSIGDSRSRFNSMFETDNMIETLVVGLTAPIFAAGALRSARDQAYFQAESSYANLLRTTLTAFEEVENSLSRENLLNQQHIAIQQAVELAEGGLNLALDRYQSGIESYTTVLQSQRSLFDSLENELNIRNALLQNRISLHLALGGDFQSTQDRDNSELPSIRTRQQPQTSQ